MQKKRSNPQKKRHSYSETELALLNSILHKSAELYQAGEIINALSLTKDALLQFPNQPLLLSNAGIFSIGLGTEQEALNFFQKSLKINPDNPETHNNLGNLFKNSKQLNKAEVAYNNALKLKPNYINALYNLGSLLLLKKSYKKAESTLNKALQLNPNHIEVYITLGNLFLEQNRHTDAETAYHKAINLNPNNADAYSNLGSLYLNQKNFEEAEICYKNALALCPAHIDILNNLGILHIKLKQLEEAEIYFKNALQVKPEHAETLNNLAYLSLEQNNYSTAIEFCQKALQLKPNYDSAYNNLGLIYLEREHFSDAETAFLSALSINLENTEVNYNLGNLYQKQKHYAKAERYYQKALTLQPNFIDARTNLAILLLMLGRFKKGWKHYEARYHPDKEDRKTFPPDFDIPQWQGESIVGKAILIWSEQGIGDEVMFASCFNDLKNLQGKIIVACDSRLINIFTHSFPFLNFIATDATNEYTSIAHTLDYHCAIGSLPHFFRNDSKDFEKSLCYLKVNNDLLTKWQERYRSLKYPINIGISWRGGKNPQYQQLRSLALSQWLPIMKHKANFINLQYGNHQTEINTFTNETGIPIYDWDDANPLSDLDNFSAQIKALSLVISIDNATVHFSGALGVKTFVLLPYNQEWRWMDKRNDSVWYPHIMRLFRQKMEGNWGNIIQDIVYALDKDLSNEN